MAAPDTPPTTLVGKLAAIAAQLERFAKSERVEGKAGYAFTGVNAMADHIRPAMAEHGIVMYPQEVELVESQQYVRERQGDRGPYEVVQWRTVVRVTWCVTDGNQALPLVTVGEALDTSDKSANKAQTAARKYAMIQLLNVTTGDDPDPDGERPGHGDQYASARGRRGAQERRGGARGTSTPPAPAGAPQTPAVAPLDDKDAAKVRRRFAALAAVHDGSLERTTKMLTDLGVASSRQLLEPAVWDQACQAAGISPAAPLPPDPREATPAAPTQEGKDG